MKTRIHYLFIFFLVWGIGSPAVAQTIHLIMDQNGLPSVKLGKANLSDQQTVPLKLTGFGLSLKLTSQLHGNALITIKGSDDQAASILEIDSLQTVLGDNGKITTDKRLQLTFKGKIYNLNQPFSIIFISSRDHSKSITVNFQPTLGNTGGGNAGDTTVAGNPGGNPIKTDPVYHPGSAVYDALKLTDQTHMTLTDLKAIIKVYFPNAAAGSSTDIVAAVKDNPFLQPLIIPRYINSTTGQAGPQSASDVLSSLSMSSIGGLDVTTLTDGLAKFLVKRVKEELSTAFFQRLQDSIKKDADLNVLFPKTAALLSNINTQVYDYNTYIQNLRETFKEDIDAMDTDLPGILPLHKAFFTTNHVLADAIISGCYLTHALENQIHPGDIIANFPIDTIMTYEKNLAWTGTVQTLQLLSESFRDTASTGNNNNYWVNLKYLRQLAGNKTSLKFFLGLVYQQALNNYNSIPFGVDGDKDSVSLVSVLDDVAGQIDNDYSVYSAYKQYIMQFAVKTDVINTMVKSYQKPANDSLAVELYKKYFDAATDMFSYSLQVTTLPGMKDVFPDIDNFKKQYNQYLHVAQSVSDLGIDINRHNYSAAINQTVNIFQLADTLTADPKLKLSNQAIHNLLRYGSFMAAIATAQNSDDVESAIEAFVLPAGSYSVKRESPFNVAINAYTGLFLGHESIQGISSNQLINAYGLTAPIGVSVSIGQRQLFNPFSGGGHSSYSLFLSVIDIGAVAAYRFKDDTTSQVPKIQLKNLFSPGVFLSIGIPKTPLCLNLGAQMGPNLRQIDYNNTTLPSADASNKIYWRYSVSLVVDIPLLNLHTASQ